MKKGITVPPLQDKHRQKKIYAQIVRSLSENIEYDWLAAADSTRENYEKATLKSWNDYVRENADRDLSHAGVEARNLLGLLRGRAVCAGNAEIIRNLVAEYSIKATGVIGPAHEWNQVELDGEWYDDDFTNYQIYLADGRIGKCTRFLNGTADGKSEFANKGYKAISKTHQVGRKWSMADKKFLLEFGKEKHRVVQEPEKVRPKEESIRDEVGADAGSKTPDVGETTTTSQAMWQDRFKTWDKAVDKMQEGAKKKQEAVKLIQDLEQDRKKDKQEQLQANQDSEQR